MHLTSKTDLEKSCLEMIRVARRLVSLKKTDPLWAGTCKTTLKRLGQLEKKIRDPKRRGQSQKGIYKVAKELAELIGAFASS